MAIPDVRDIQTIALMERIEGLEGLVDSQGRQIEQLLAENGQLKNDIHTIRELSKEVIETLRIRIDEVNFCLARDIAYDRKRISALERVPQNLKPIFETRLEKLDGLLVSRRNQPMTFSEVGKILELGSRSGKTNTRRQNMTHFSKILLSKVNCYIISDSRTVNGKLVRLTAGYYEKLLRGRGEV